MGLYTLNNTMAIPLMIFGITDVSPTIVRLIVNSLTAILPYVCLPNQPFTKWAFIANLTQTTLNPRACSSLLNPVGHVSPSLTHSRQAVIVGKLS